jgi:hypothetical protein
LAVVAVQDRDLETYGEIMGTMATERRTLHVDTYDVVKAISYSTLPEQEYTWLEPVFKLNYHVFNTSVCFVDHSSHCLEMLLFASFQCAWDTVNTPVLILMAHKVCIWPAHSISDV